MLYIIISTPRWKGENVSTIEVSNIIAQIEWIEDANLYGIKIPSRYIHECLDLAT